MMRTADLGIEAITDKSTRRDKPTILYEKSTYQLTCKNDVCEMFLNVFLSLCETCW